MTVEQILIKAKNIVENKGNKKKIYDLLLNIEYDPEDYSFKENEKLIFSLYDLQDKIANDLQENFKESKSQKSNLSSLESITLENMKYIKQHQNRHFIKQLIINKDNDFTTKIKLYFNIDPSKINEFMTKYTLFAFRNKIDSFYKSRLENATDMVTIRIDDIEHLNKVVEFIKQYNNKDNTNPLINTIDGIGYTLDNGESYNDFLTDVIYDYVSTTDNINESSFRNYLKKQREEIKFPKFDLNSSKNDSKFIFYDNLSNFVDEKEFSISEFKEKFISLRKIEIEQKYKNELIDKYIKELINKYTDIKSNNNINIKESIKKEFVENKTLYKEEIEITDEDISNYCLEKYNIDVIEYINDRVEENIDQKKKELTDSLDVRIKRIIKNIIQNLAYIRLNGDESIQKEYLDRIINDDKIYTINDKPVTMKNILNYYIVTNQEYTSVYNLINSETELFVKNVKTIEQFCNDEKENIDIRDILYDLYDSMFMDTEESINELGYYIPFNENTKNSIFKKHYDDMIISVLCKKYNVDNSDEYDTNNKLAEAMNNNSLNNDTHRRKY